MIQPVNAWDVFVFPSGHICYRVNTRGRGTPLEAQCYPVGDPLYKQHVMEMRRQAKLWHDDHRMTPQEEATMTRRHKHMIDFDVCYTEPLMNRNRNKAEPAATMVESGVTRHRLGT